MEMTTTKPTILLDSQSCATGHACPIKSCLSSFVQLKPPAAGASAWWLAKFGSGVLLLVLHILIGQEQLWGEWLVGKNALLARGICGVLFQILFGLPVYTTVIGNLRQHKTKLVAVLVSLAAFGASLFFALADPDRALAGSFALFSVSPTLVVFMALVFHFEVRALGDVHTAATHLENLRVEEAYKEDGGSVISVDTTELKPGDTLHVFAGDRIPRDGVILKGTTSVDESAFTGEFKPLLKEKGERVIGGSINRDSDITVRIDASRDQDVLEGMIRRIHATLSETATMNVRTTRVATTLANLAILLAVACFGFHFWARQAPVGTALTFAFSVLLATPLSLIALVETGYIGFLGSGLRRGAFIAKGIAIETIARIHAIFFNKTGTLSLGDFVYSQSFIEAGTNQGEFLTSVFSLEAASEHPLAKAMRTHPWYLEITKLPVRDVEVHPGLGLSGIVMPRSFSPFFVACGNLRYMKRLRFHISREMKAKIDDLEEMGESVVLCGIERPTRTSTGHQRMERTVTGIMSFSDTMRKGVRSTLRRIQHLGIESALITGDTEKTVTQLTGTLGIKKIYSRCTPDEKRGKILKEKEGGAKVALMDTDTCDNPALAEADLSLTLDTGTAIQSETADIIILGSDFSLVFWLLRKARVVFNLVQIAEIGSAALLAVLAAGAFAGWIQPTFSFTLATAWSLLSLKVVHRQIMTDE